MNSERNDKMLSFGQRLKILRKGAQLTQAELAERLMVSVQSVSKWECDTTMPDVSQIMPLAAVLGVTADCLLGGGGDEKADRAILLEEIAKISGGIDPVYRREDRAYEMCCRLYREHIRKYPLDFEIKLRCADSLVRCIYYGTEPAEEKDRLYEEAIAILKSVIHCDRDTTRQIDAMQTLVILYLYKNEFAAAEEIARGLPEKGSLRAAMEIEIYSKKNDHQKCLALSEQVCCEAVHHYLWALAVRAKRISLLGDERKQDAIAAWHTLADAAKRNYQLFCDIKINTKWLYSALNHLANDYIAVDARDGAFEVIEELANTLVCDWRTCRESGDDVTAAEIKGNFRFYLHSCYNLCDQSIGSAISGDPRFQACERLLESIE